MVRVIKFYFSHLKKNNKGNNFYSMYLNVMLVLMIVNLSKKLLKMYFTTLF